MNFQGKIYRGFVRYTKFIYLSYILVGDSILNIEMLRGDFPGLEAKFPWGFLQRAFSKEEEWTPWNKLINNQELNSSS